MSQISHFGSLADFVHIWSQWSIHASMQNYISHSNFLNAPFLLMHRGNKFLFENEDSCIINNSIWNLSK